MEINKLKSIIEAILFAAGRPVTKKELVLSLEISEEDIESIISNMQEEYQQQSRILINYVLEKICMTLFIQY